MFFFKKIIDRIIYGKEYCEIMYGKKNKTVKYKGLESFIKGEGKVIDLRKKEK